MAAIGGKVEYKASGRLDVTLSAAAVEALRKHGRVKYIQKAALGPPSPAAAASVLRLKPAATSLHPKTDATPPTWLSGTYLYDTSGNIYAIGLAGDTGSPPQHHYAYDTLSRLTTANTTATLLPNEAFVYDDYGNMTSHTVGSITTPMSVVTATNRFTTGGTSSYQYDAVGNLTADAEAAYAYDPFSMLREKDYQAKLPEFYIYTASDERIGVKYDMYTTWSIRDFSGNVLRQYKGMDDQSNVAWLWVEDYIYRDGQLLGAERVPEEGGRRHFHLDHLGSPRLVTSTQTSSNEMSEHEFAPFGMEVNPLWQETTGGFDREDPKRLTGHERDYASDGQLQTTKYLDYMHARYYSPGGGRFLSVDRSGRYGPTARPQSWNRYSYASNNPLARIDPDGLRDIYVAVWNARLLSGSVGHVGAFELNGKAILSQFPTPHGRHGKNTIQQDYAHTVKAEERKPDLIYLVHVPNDAKFDAAAASQLAPQTKSWDWQPSALNSETNCVVAVAAALDAGGVPVPAVHKLLTPDEFGLQLGALSIESEYDLTNNWSVSSMSSLNNDNIRPPRYDLFRWFTNDGWLFGNSFGTQIEVTRQ